MKHSFVCRVLVLLLLCVTLVSCTATDTVTTADTTSPVTEEQPPVVDTLEIYEEIIGSIRIQLYSESVLRIEKSDATGLFCDSETIAVTNRTDWPGVEVTREEKDGNIILTTSAYTVCVPAEAKDTKDITVTDTDGKAIWTENRSNEATVYLPEPARTPTAWAFADSPRVIIPENGFTEVINESDNGFKYSTDTEDNYIFVCNGDPIALRADYNKLVGQCNMVTLKSLGLWFSRYYPYHDIELLDLVDTYRDKGYPIDYIVCDTDWKIGASTGYEINTKYFRDMPGFLEKMHDKNINIVFNDHVREYSGSLLDAEQIEWFNENLTEKLNMGLDTWWYDRNWGYTLNSPFDGIPSDMFGQLLYLSISEAYNAPLNKRTVLLSNYHKLFSGHLRSPSYIGTHRYSIQWTGDIEVNILPQDLENLVDLGVYTSSAYISSDIGGHMGTPSDELFIRWTQFGALSPIMRYHSSSSDRSPWVYGRTADEVANTYINMRYRLLPLFYNLAYENYELGLPMARRLDFYYSQYKEARASDQYLLGEDILVAPITRTDYGFIPDAWFKTADGKSGVTVNYYNNIDLSGDPVVTRREDNMNINCNASSPADGVNADNFSAVMESTLTIGDYDVYIGVKSDDGVRIYLDGELVIDHWKASDSETVVNKDVVLKAGTSYDLRVEYYDGIGIAFLELQYEAVDPKNNVISDERTVFIPDGTWMDVFSGETYTGPQTITVTHSLTTSPIFVRLGSVTALAYKADYADTNDWQRLALDVYPADGTKDTSVLYEDDGASLDYQSGSFRKTEMSVETNNGETTIKISAAEGEYKTEWTEREWTVRLHASDVESVTVNGNAVEFSVIEKDASAAPFASEGASPDGDVVTVTFKAAIDSESVIVIK